MRTRNIGSEKERIRKRGCWACREIQNGANKPRRELADDVRGRGPGPSNGRRIPIESVSKVGYRISRKLLNGDVEIIIHSMATHARPEEQFVPGAQVVINSPSVNIFRLVHGSGKKKAVCVDSVSGSAWIVNRAGIAAIDKVKEGGVVPNILWINTRNLIGCEVGDATRLSRETRRPVAARIAINIA